MSFSLRFVRVFAAVTLLDLLWTKYVQHVASGLAIRASMASAGIAMGSSLVVVAHIEDHRMLAANVLGAFAGTYIGVARR